MGSVRQLAHDRGDQAHHQGQRDHEVSDGIEADGIAYAAADFPQGRRHEMAAEE